MKKLIAVLAFSVLTGYLPGVMVTSANGSTRVEYQKPKPPPKPKKAPKPKKPPKAKPPKAKPPRAPQPEKPPRPRAPEPPTPW